MSKDKKESSLKTRPGVRPPKNKIRGIKQSPLRELSTAEFVSGVLDGDRVVLARAITLVESALSEHTTQALEIIEQCLPHTGNSIRVGITGVPGVGKSMFIESFGTHLTGVEGRKVAVLAIDPTSIISGGSILGDKTRMEELSKDPNAFIRPSPTAGSLGGVARKTRETILLCEAAGFDTIIVETVGVGQSETTVHSMVDFFLLLMLTGAGDELQGMKRGIMEMADSIAITKADGVNKTPAEVARKLYQSAVELFAHSASGWTPKVLTCSAVMNEGINDIWETIVSHKRKLDQGSFFSKKRKEQIKNWLHETIRSDIDERFYNDPQVKKSINRIEEDVVAGRLSAFTGAQKLLDLYFKKFEGGL